MTERGEEIKSTTNSPPKCGGLCGLCGLGLACSDVVRDVVSNSTTSGPLKRYLGMVKYTNFHSVKNTGSRLETNSKSVRK